MQTLHLFKYEMQSKKTAGFTLVELVVAVALFAVVMTVVAGALLTIVDANRKALAQQVVISNLNFALESMSRALRVGSAYHCDASQGDITQARDCPSGTGADSIAFEAGEGDYSNSADQRIFRLNTSTHQIERSVDSGVTWIAITAPEIYISNLKFFVKGADGSAEGSGALQARVVFVVRGYSVTADRSRVYFNLSTAVSQRILDI